MVGVNPVLAAKAKIGKVARQAAGALMLLLLLLLSIGQLDRLLFMLIFNGAKAK